MLAHERLEKQLVYFVVRAPLVTDNVVGDRLDKALLQVVVRPLVLEVGVGVRADTFGVVKFHVGVIRAQHVDYDQVDYCFFPGQDHWVLEVFKRVHLVFFQFLQGALLRHITLPEEVGHRIDLEEDEVGHVLGDDVEEEIERFGLIGHLRQRIKHRISITRVISLQQRLKIRFLQRSVRQRRPRILQIVFGAEALVGAVWRLGQQGL